MSFFWVYLRYQSYFGLLYPLDSPTGTSPAFGVLLVVLLVLCAFSIAFRTRIEKIFLTQRFSVVLLSAMASGGAAMALAADSGLLGAWALWASLPLVAAGFVAGYLGWATYFCYRFGPSDIVVLAASYLASLVFFTQWVPYLVAVFVPLGVGVSWFFAQPPRGSCFQDLVSERGNAFRSALYSVLALGKHLAWDCRFGQFGCRWPPVPLASFGRRVCHRIVRMLDFGASHEGEANGPEERGSALDAKGDRLDGP